MNRHQFRRIIMPTILALVCKSTPPTMAAFPDGWAGYVTHSVATEPTSAVTDFTFLISLNQFPSDFWMRVRSDGGDIRASKDPAGVFPLPVDVIEFTVSGSSGSGMIAVKWTGAKSSSNDEPLYIWVGNSSATLPGRSEQFGRDNAYAAHIQAFWPSGGGEDRTRNNNELAMVGGVSVGGAAGPINGAKATAYDGTSQYGTATASVPTTTPLTIIHHGKADVNNARMCSVAVAHTAAASKD